MAHTIVHVEVPAKDPKAATEFYNALFDWKMEVDTNFDYHQFTPESGPGGAFVGLSDGGEHGPPTRVNEPLIYVSTDDIPASLAKAESLGAKTIVPETEIPHTGWFAVFADPSGNHIGLYKSIHAAG
jgi:uncharacterized protein